jgi:lysophospholipase L1-like esterase
MTMSENNKASVALPLWKKILFSVVGVLLLATVLELSASWYLRHFRGYDGQHLLQYEFDPYKVILPTRGYRDTRGLQHNAQGFRHPVEVSRRKEEGAYRIFLMGGSSAYGTGGLWTHIDPNYRVLHDSVTISAYLQQMLEERLPGRQIEVINAAITSSWTHQHLIYLNQSLLRYEPDLIVLMDGFNDFFHFGEYHDQFASYAYRAHADVIMGDPTVKALIFSNAWWWSRRSAFIHVLYRQMQQVGALLRPRRPREPMDPDAAFEGLQRVFPNNALKMVERAALLLNHEQVDALFVLQPLLILERDRPGAPEMEQRLFEFNVASYLPRYEEFIHKAVPYVSQRVRDAVEPLGGQYLDATGVYRGIEGQIYTDYAHLTPLGNRVLASRLADRITLLAAGQADQPDAAREGS